jgi:uncharacterized protein YcnI
MTSSTTTPGRTTRTAALRWAGAGLGAAILALAVPGTASAHVSMSADTAAAGSYAVLTFAVPHGCDGAATTRVAVRLPAGLHTVTPTINPGWTVDKRTEKLSEPVTTAHGSVLTERVAEVVWTARTPLPEGYRDTLSLQVPLPEDAAGQQLVFPTVQTCTEGETAWTQVAAPGQDPETLEHPAPTLDVAAAEGGHGHGHASAPAAETAGTAPAATALQATAGTSGADLVGPALGALGLAAGLTALARTRGARTRPDQH